MEGSVFHIIIIEQCLLGVNEVDLLQIDREMDLPVIDATPKKILQLLQSNFKGFEDVDREKISSHLQKYRDSLKKEAQPPMTTVANEPDILSQQQQDPAAKTLKAFRMDASSSEQMRNEFTGGQPFDWESVLNVPDELSSLETFLVGVSGGPDLYYNNAPLLGPFHTDHGEHGCSQDVIAENFNGDVSACEHFNNL
uniref:Uncharacterized protein n=1 Tax=Quercus lobata TaxID=97700 RepID=A0A7N2LN72_QUELO